MNPEHTDELGEAQEKKDYSYALSADRPDVPEEVQKIEEAKQETRKHVADCILHEIGATWISQTQGEDDGYLRGYMDGLKAALDFTRTNGRRIK